MSRRLSLVGNSGDKFIAIQTLISFSLPLFSLFKKYNFVEIRIGVLLQRKGKNPEWVLYSNKR
jgi:hypothetical protein